MLEELKIDDDILNDKDKVISLFRKMRAKCEFLEQENYALRKHELTLKAVQDDLSSELESRSKKHEYELQSLQLKNNDLKLQHNERIAALENERESQINLALEENKQLREKLLESLNKFDSFKNTTNDTISDLEMKYGAQIVEIKNSNQIKLEEVTELFDKTLIENKYLHEQMEIIKEEAECSKENLNYKKEEIEQLKELILELQEKISILQMSQNMEPEEHEKKGNSLFAEVNDRRLKLEHIVRKQRTTFLEMKRKFAKSINENELVKSQIIRLERHLKELLPNLGLEDERLKKAYEDYTYVTNLKVQDLQNKIMRLEKEIVKTSSNGLYDILERTRNELKEKELLIENLYYGKFRLEDTIHKTTKDLNRWKAEALLYSAENAKLKLQISNHTINFSENTENIHNDSPEHKLEIEDSNSIEFSTTERRTKDKVYNYITTESIAPASCTSFETRADILRDNKSEIALNPDLELKKIKNGSAELENYLFENRESEYQNLLLSRESTSVMSLSKSEPLINNKIYKKSNALSNNFENQGETSFMGTLNREKTCEEKFCLSPSNVGISNDTVNLMTLKSTPENRINEQHISNEKVSSFLTDFKIYSDTICRELTNTQNMYPENSTNKQNISSEKVSTPLSEFKTCNNNICGELSSAQNRRSENYTNKQNIPTEKVSSCLTDFEIYNDTICLKIASEQSSSSEYPTNIQNMSTENVVTTSNLDIYDDSVCLNSVIRQKTHNEKTLFSSNFEIYNDTMASVGEQKICKEKVCSSASSFDIYNDTIYLEPAKEQNMVIQKSCLPFNNIKIEHKSSTVKSCLDANNFEIYNDEICSKSDEIQKRIDSTLSIDEYEFDDNPVFLEPTLGRKTTAVIMCSSTSDFDDIKDNENNFEDNKNLKMRKPPILKGKQDLLLINDSDDDKRLMKKGVKFCETVKSPNKSENFTKKNEVKKVTTAPIYFFKPDPSKVLTVKRLKKI